MAFEAQMAFGRILRIASRPEMPGDVAEYERCRRIIVDALPPQDYSEPHDYGRDRLRGAQGD